nr:hypothetical protein [Tanacetum cinerariifolium]
GEVFLVEVDFDAPCRGDSDFCLGGDDGVLISKLSSIEETRLMIMGG